LCKGNKRCDAEEDEIPDNIQRIIFKLVDDSLSSEDWTNEATNDHDNDGSDENDKDARLD
jgi:hypothetical protein